MLALCWRCTVCSSTLSAATHERRSLLDRPSGARGLHFTSSRCSLMAVHSTRRSKHSVSPWRPEMDAYVLLRRFHHHLQKSRVQFSFGGSYRSARYIPSPGALQATYRCRYVAPPEAICSAGHIRMGEVSPRPRERAGIHTSAVWAGQGRAVWVSHPGQVGDRAG